MDESIKIKWPNVWDTAYLLGFSTNFLQIIFIEHNFYSEETIRNKFSIHVLILFINVIMFWVDCKCTRVSSQ
jgi:hypothetical protein